MKTRGTGKNLPAERVMKCNHSHEHENACTIFRESRLSLTTP